MGGRTLKSSSTAAAAIFNNPIFGVQLTAGSFSVRGRYTELRRTGAAGREMLISAAAKQWGCVQRPIEPTGRRVPSVVPHAVLKVYPGGAHGIAIVDPERVNADLLAFVNG